MLHIKPGGSIILMGNLGEGPPPGHTYNINFLMLSNFLSIFVRNVNCGRLLLQIGKGTCT